MNYLTNNDGDVKVRHENGVEKWIPKHLAENKFLMKGQGLTPVEAPVKFEAIITEPVIEITEPVIKETTKENITVADKAPAKSGKAKKQ